MNLNKALEILGLNINFTEEELKRAYRKLIAKYHPDKFANGSIEQKEAEEMAKQINQAKEILDNYLRKKIEEPEQNQHYQYNEYQYSDQTEESKFKNELYQKIKNMEIETAAMLSTLKDDELIQEIAKKILIVIKITSIKVLRTNRLTKLLQIEEEYNNEIENIIYDYIKKYIKKYKIKITDSTILHTYSLKIAFEKLEKIREKSTSFVEDLLEREKKKWMTHPYYEKTKFLIEDTKKDIIIKCKYVSMSREEILSEFNNRVRNVINEYIKREKIIKEYKFLYSNNPKLLRIIKKLENYILYPEIFNQINEEITAILTIPFTKPVKENIIKKLIKKII